jgi:aspartyl-tRNA(Asn)/glutamyl-tRNA(Gln) amidotransferase subunit C
MSLSNDDVKKIAHLARLALTEQESKDFAGSLTQIFGLIEQMNAVDTDGIEPMAHPSDAGLRLREDVVKEKNQREEFQALAPATEAGLYLVPKVLE